MRGNGLVPLLTVALLMAPLAAGDATDVPLPEPSADVDTEAGTLDVTVPFDTQAAAALVPDIHVPLEIPVESQGPVTSDDDGLRVEAYGPGVSPPDAPSEAPAPGASEQDHEDASASDEPASESGDPAPDEDPSDDPPMPAAPALPAAPQPPTRFLNLVEAVLGQADDDGEPTDDEGPVAAQAHETQPFGARQAHAAVPDALGELGPVQIAALGATAAGLGLAVGWRTLLMRAAPGAVAAFTRVRESRVLDHPRRREIYDSVRAQPGERLELVRRRLQIPNGSMMHHLRILDHHNLVRVHREGAMARLYPAGPRVQPAPYLDATRRRVLAELQAQPGAPQRAVAARLNLSERVVSYHVAWLRRHGLLQVRRDGATNRCFPTPEAATALA